MSEPVHYHITRDELLEEIHRVFPQGDTPIYAFMVFGRSYAGGAPVGVCEIRQDWNRPSHRKIQKEEIPHRVSDADANA